MHWVAASGTSHEEMVRTTTTKISHELQAIPGVRNFGAHIGQAPQGDEVVGINFTENWISIDKNVDYDKTLAAIHKVVDKYPGYQTDVQTYLKERTKEVIAGGSESIAVRIFGDDLSTLRAKAAEVKQMLSGIDGVVDEHVELQVDVPQIEVEVDLAKAQQYGIKPGDVRRSASILIHGEEVGDIWRLGRNLEVHVFSVPQVRADVKSVSELPIDTADGGMVRLGDIATVRVAATPNVIFREGQSRKIDIGANVHGRDLGSVAREVERKLQTIQLPRGYDAQVLGEYAERQAAERRLLLFAGVALLGIFLLLQLAFGRWLLALLSLFTLPMALVGGVLATLVGGAVVSRVARRVLHGARDRGA
jgi:Cu/Ag efflux pump CusA